tara:strand:- start:2486 stop:3319 length:834 start_codon:yes stop_codon:yes gene_type:complete
MKDFKDKVAVITGAASGIGKGLAERCIQEGMKVVLSDIEEKALKETEEELKSKGGEVLSVVTDVSQFADVEKLAQKTLGAFGGVHVLCNNAGVASGVTTWGTTSKEWDWVIGVNLMGTIHGLRAFVPLMTAQRSEGHIVNTGSIAGFLSYYFSAPYQVTKHAVTALTENLHHTLTGMESKIKVSLLCPAWVKTQIMDSHRNRPSDMHDPTKVPMPSVLQEEIEKFRGLVEQGMAPKKVAELVFKGMMEEQFYIFTHPEMGPYIQKRFGPILEANGLP